MIYSCVPDELVFFDKTYIRQRHIKLYDNISFELTGGRIERIISTNPQDFLKYGELLGTDYNTLLARKK